MPAQWHSVYTFKSKIRKPPKKILSGQKEEVIYAPQNGANMHYFICVWPLKPEPKYKPSLRSRSYWIKYYSKNFVTNEKKKILGGNSFCNMICKTFYHQTFLGADKKNTKIEQFSTVIKMGAIIWWRGTWSMFQSFQLMYLHILCS